MIISILKRALSVSLLFSISYHASAQDVWINLFRDNGQLIKVNANRVDKVNFLEAETTNKIGIKQYAGTRVDLTGNHFVTYNANVNTVEGVYDGNTEEEIQASTLYNGNVYHFYHGGGLYVYQVSPFTKITNKKLTSLAGFTLYNVGMSSVTSYPNPADGGATNVSLTTPCVFVTGKDDATKNIYCKMIDIENDREVGNIPASGTTEITSKIVSCVSSDALWTIHKDEESNAYKFSKHTMTSGSVTGAPQTNLVNVDIAEGIYGDVIDASCYKNQIFLMVQNAGESTRFLVYNTDYNKVVSVLEGGVFNNPFGFVVDKGNRRFIVLGTNGEGQAEWNDMYIDKIPDDASASSSTSKNASSKMYVRMSMHDGTVFQTQIRNLTHFKITEGDESLNQNVTSYSGQQVDFGDKQMMYYYEDESKQMAKKDFDNSGPADAVQGTLFRYYNSAKNTDAKIVASNFYTQEEKATFSLSALNNYKITGIRFSSTNNYKLADGTVVSSSLPLLIATGYDNQNAAESNQRCVVCLVDAASGIIIKTDYWTGHTKANTPSFVSAWDFSIATAYFVGQVTGGNYQVQSAKATTDSFVLNDDAKTVVMDTERLLYGALVDCVYANGVIYALVNGGGGNTKIFGANPKLWTINNILTFGAVGAIEGMSAGTNGITGTPTAIIPDAENQHLIINTRLTAGDKGSWWNVFFE